MHFQDFIWPYQHQQESRNSSGYWALWPIQLICTPFAFKSGTESCRSVLYISNRLEVPLPCHATVYLYSDIRFSYSHVSLSSSPSIFPSLSTPFISTYRESCDFTMSSATAPAAPSTPSSSAPSIDDKPQRLERSEDAFTTDSEKGPVTTSPPPEPEQVRTVTGWKWVVICVGFYVATFLYGLDNTIAADIQSAVLGTYGDISKLSWLGTGFPLGSIATILTMLVLLMGNMIKQKLTSLLVVKHMAPSMSSGPMSFLSSSSSSAVLFAVRLLT